MKKRFFQLVLTAVLSVSCVATGVNVSAAPLSSEGYSIEKVSHPERGAGETDGILSFDAMGEESNRNQSYVWSCVEHGNYIYLGTCWNPISGIYYRNLKNNLTKLFQNRGDENPAQKAGTVATNILNVVYNGNFPDGATSTNGTPCIMRVNKYTYETEVVYIEKESSAFVNWNGIRPVYCGVQMVIFRVICVGKSRFSIVSVWFLGILLSWCYHTLCLGFQIIFI